MSGRPAWLGSPERRDPAPLRRRGKEAWERALATGLLLPATPVVLAIAAAIKAEGLLDPDARGPVFFVERRISRGREIDLLKFRTLSAPALHGLGDGPTHIKAMEKTHVTRVGKVLKDWYLDELPQLINIVRGDMFLIGTRPWPIEPAEAEIARGISRKHDMPAGLVGPVQSYKGRHSPTEHELDEEYWEAFRTWDAWRLFRFDLSILRRSVAIQLAHEGR